MNFQNFIEPKEIVIGERTFAISKIPAFYAKPVFEDYIKVYKDQGDLAKTMLSEASYRQMFKYCAVKNKQGDFESLETTQHIETYLPDLITMYNLAVKEFDYNFDFFGDGTLLDLLGIKEAATESV